MLHVQKVDFDYPMLRKVCDAAGGVVRSSNRRSVNIQYRCLGDGAASPIVDLCHGDVLDVLYECREELMPKLPNLNEKELHYLVVPTLTHLLCSYCPKRPGNYLPENPVVKKLKMTECGSEIAKLVEQETDTNMLDEQLLQKEFYEHFWELEPNKRLLIGRLKV